MNPSYIQTVVDESIKTVGVQFAEDKADRGGPYTSSLTVYTYKTRIDFEEGDRAIVFVNGQPKFVVVTEIHEDPEIGPGSKFTYKWIMQKVDTEAYEAASDADNEFEKRYRAEVRRKDRKNIKEQLIETLGKEFLGLE